MGCSAAAQGSTIRENCPVKKRHFLRHLYIKGIILPRQARDKHRESTQKQMAFPSLDHRAAHGKQRSEHDTQQLPFH
jgi:hypothetical protein